MSLDILDKNQSFKMAHQQQKKVAVQATVAVGFVSPGNCPIVIKCIDTEQRGRKKKIIHGKHSQIAILKIDLQSNQSTDEKTKVGDKI